MRPKRGHSGSKKTTRAARAASGGLPVLLRTKDWPVLVVGGGAVAARKIRVLLAAGAKVFCVAPRVAPAVRELAAKGRIVWRAREFRDSDLAAARLAVTATDSPELAAEIAAAARARGVLVNSAENPEAGDLFLTSSRRAGGFLISVSTLGRSPEEAKRMADRLARAAGAKKV